MTSGGEDEVDEKPIGELFGQLIDEGKAYAKAELGLAKATAEAKADEFKWPAILLFSALLFAQAAVTVAAVTVVMALAPLVGPLAGGIVAILLAAGAAWLLYMAAINRMKAGS
ncbi:MAG: phage holin family protein [Sphingomicrobium sp.]|jgi:hypothetical protein